MTDIINTIPSFLINKQEFLILWVKNYIKKINIDYIKSTEHDYSLDGSFLHAFGLITQDQFQKQVEQMDDQVSVKNIFQGHKLWTYKKEEILNFKFMLALLHTICPHRFKLDCENFQTLINSDFEDFAVFNEILYHMKCIFIQMNLDGKQLFRAISQDFQQNKQGSSEKMTMKILELIFVVAFLHKDLKNGHEIFSVAQDFSECKPKNILLTKCTYGIINDVLNEFTVVQQNPSQNIDKFEFDLYHQQTLMEQIFEDPSKIQNDDVDTIYSSEAVKLLEQQVLSAKKRLQNETLAQVSQLSNLAPETEFPDEQKSSFATPEKIKEMPNEEKEELQDQIQKLNQIKTQLLRDKRILKNEMKLMKQKDAKVEGLTVETLAFQDTQVEELNVLCDDLKLQNQDQQEQISKALKQAEYWKMLYKSNENQKVEKELLERSPEIAISTTSDPEVLLLDDQMPTFRPSPEKLMLCNEMDLDQMEGLRKGRPSDPSIYKDGGSSNSGIENNIFDVAHSVKNADPRLNYDAISSLLSGLTEQEEKDLKLGKIYNYSPVKSDQMQLQRISSPENPELKDSYHLPEFGKKDQQQSCRDSVPSSNKILEYQEQQTEFFKKQTDILSKTLVEKDQLLNSNCQYVERYYESRDQLKTIQEVLNSANIQIYKLARERSQLYQKKKSYIDFQGLVLLFGMVCVAMECGYRIIRGQQRQLQTTPLSTRRRYSKKIKR